MDFTKAIIEQAHQDAQDEPLGIRYQIEDDIRNGLTDDEIRNKKYETRGGPRPGSGRKPMNPELKKQKKAFSLSPESVQALADLQKSLGLGSQSAVIEFLVLKASRELCGDGPKLVER